MKCDDPENPTPCQETHGVPAGCYTVDVACQTLVECPFGVAACSDTGYAVDCTAAVCIPIRQLHESTNYLCSNGLDDDNDGKADCADPFCRTQNIAVCNSESTDHECTNNDDDDGDGYVDCADYDCRYSPAVTKCPQFEWRDEACENADDDDGDGYVDCDDNSCYSAFSFVCW